MKKAKTEFGKELRRLRTEGSIKYTQAGLAKLAGVTAGYISQLETEDLTPRVSVIRNLSRHLGVEPNHLLRTIGMVEMDISRTYTWNVDAVREKMPDLAAEQIAELANYLTYLDFKASALR